jgi:aldehyde dehydrogenase (NAD+)
MNQDTAVSRTPFLHYNTMDTPPTGTSLQFTPVENIEPIVAEARNFFSTGRTLSLSWRLQQLTAVKTMLERNKASIIQALQEDQRRPTLETILGEYTLVLSELEEAMSHLTAWNAPTTVSVKTLTSMPSDRNDG